MAGEISELLRTDLLDRRERLQGAIGRVSEPSQIRALLEEVDAALARMGTGAYGLCETCHDAIEPDRLIADPLARHCLDHLTPVEQRALSRDLELATRIQLTMLPQCRLSYGEWDVCHHFEPVGHVGGDYCDAVLPEDGGPGDAYFLLGDVAGKGVAASLLMASLQATFRTLIAGSQAIEQLLERANSVFCRTTMPGHYATLICCRACSSGLVQVANAGHPPALVGRGDSVTEIGATGMPLGMFCSAAYTSRTVTLEPGDLLLLYSDGLIEAEDAAGRDYGLDRLRARVRAAAAEKSATSAQVVADCVADLKTFQGGSPRADDLTLMAIRRL